MAERPKGFGMIAQVSGKREVKYDALDEGAICNWVKEITSHSCPGIGSKVVQEWLKDGKVLCNLIIKITGKPFTYNTSSMAFKHMENIGLFLAACENYGVRKQDLFQTADLYESENMERVLTSLMALSRAADARGFDGPSIHPSKPEGF